MAATRTIDTPFLTITIILLVVGFLIFFSASLGLIAREGITASAVVVNQLFGLLVGVSLLVAALFVPYHFWNTYAFYIFLAALFGTLLVFVPGLGFSHGGATRWISLGPLSLQPAEFLKFGFVIYYAAWIAGVRERMQTFRYGVLPLGVLLGLCAFVLGLQPDLGTFLVIALTGGTMLVVGGGRWLHIIGLGALAGGSLLLTGLFVPYIQARLLTFINPSADALGAGYQIQQSLIAIGSGSWFGRGFGQSVQKFNFLPEPVGDSIFAVFAEEWGFVGAVVLIALFVAFALRGLKIANGMTKTFPRMVVVGGISMIVLQSFVNIASMLGIFPLTGMPLLFVSQGGSALMVTMLLVGLLLNISRFQKRKV